MVLEGKVVKEDFGLFGIKIIGFNNQKKNTIISYEFIKYNFDTNQFKITYDLEEDIFQPIK